MIVNRNELLAALKIAAPALAGAKNQVLELSHFWFDGTHLSAYDDLIGVKLDFPTEFKGGVLGDKLIGVLECCSDKEVEMTREDDGNLMLTAGGAMITFALRPIEDWFWHPEPPEKAESYRLTKEFIQAVELTLLSVGSAKILNPEQRGITIIQNGDVSADLYSTDATAISWMQVPLAKGERVLSPEMDRCIVPTQFCEILTKNAKPNSEILFDENSVYLYEVIKLGEGEDRDAQVLFFSKLVEDETPLPFEDVVQGYIKGKGSFPIPGLFKQAIDRSLVMLEAEQPADLRVGKGETKKTADRNYLYLYAETPHGVVDDAVEIKGEHPHIKVRVDSSLIKRGLDGRETMTVTDECLVMTGPKGFIHIVATK